jgi:hypothetical protein
MTTARKGLAESRRPLLSPPKRAQNAAPCVSVPWELDKILSKNRETGALLERKGTPKTTLT